MHLTAKEILSGFQCLQKTEELPSLKNIGPILLQIMIFSFASLNFIIIVL